MQRAGLSWPKIMLWAAIMVAALGFLYLVRSILMPFVLAFIISVLLEPTIQKLRRRGVSQGMAIALVFILFFGSLTVVGALVTPMATTQLRNFSSNLQTLTNQLAESESQSVFERWNPVERATQTATVNPIDRMLEQFREPLGRVGVPANRRALVQQYIEPHRERIANGVKTFFNSFFSILLSAGSQFFMLLFTPVFVFLMLRDFEQMRIRSATYIPTSIRAETLALIREIGQVFISYLRGVTISVSVYTAIVTVTLSIMGVPYAILLALLAGALYMIPWLGFFIALGSVFLVTGLTGATGNWFMHMADPWMFAAVCAGVYTAVFFVYDNFVNPRLIGRSVGLSILVSMFVVFSGAALFGIAGMILAFPVAGSIKVILNRVLKFTSSTSTSDLRLPVTPLRHRTSGEI